MFDDVVIGKGNSGNSAVTVFAYRKISENKINEIREALGLL